jgi:hypothetical protein
MAGCTTTGAEAFVLLLDVAGDVGCEAAGSSLVSLSAGALADGLLPDGDVAEGAVALPPAFVPVPVVASPPFVAGCCVLPFEGVPAAASVSSASEEASFSAGCCTIGASFSTGAFSDEPLLLVPAGTAEEGAVAELSAGA